MQAFETSTHRTQRASAAHTRSRKQRQKKRSSPQSRKPTRGRELKRWSNRYPRRLACTSKKERLAAVLGELPTQGAALSGQVAVRSISRVWPRMRSRIDSHSRRLAPGVALRTKDGSRFPACQTGESREFKCRLTIYRVRIPEGGLFPPSRDSGRPSDVSRTTRTRRPPRDRSSGLVRRG